MATTNHLQAVEKKRGQIERVREELEWVANSPLPRIDAKSAITDWVTVLQQGVETVHMSSTLAAMTAPDLRAQRDAANNLFRVNTRAVQIGSAPNVLPVEVQLAPALLWLLGTDEFTARLHARVDALEYTPGPPLAERAPRRDVLVKELRALELEEEALICSAEEASVYIARRADADPASILGYSPSGTMHEHGPRGVPFGWEAKGAVSAPTGTQAAPGSASANSNGMPAPAARGADPGSAATSFASRLFR